MKNKVIVVLAVFAVAFVFGIYLYWRSPSTQMAYKRWKSSAIGLKREITFYPPGGKPEKVWLTRSKVEVDGAAAWFLDENGKSVILLPSAVIEEK